MSRIACAVLTLTVLTACTGDAGPTGPAGPQGPQPGPPGPAAQSVVATGTLNEEGFGGVHLPASAGTIASLPTVVCYVTDDPQQGVYTVIASDRVLDVDDVLVEVQACLIFSHLDHVDVVVFSAPDWSYIIVATPSI